MPQLQTPKNHTAAHAQGMVNGGTQMATAGFAAVNFHFWARAILVDEDNAAIGNSYAMVCTTGASKRQGLPPESWQRCHLVLDRSLSHTLAVLNF